VQKHNILGKINNMVIKILEEITGELRKKIIAIEDLKIEIIKLQMIENHQMKTKLIPITG
jgi:hypothetical protein